MLSLTLSACEALWPIDDLDQQPQAEPSETGSAGSKEAGVDASIGHGAAAGKAGQGGGSDATAEGSAGCDEVTKGNSPTCVSCLEKSAGLGACAAAKYACSEDDACLAIADCVGAALTPEAASSCVGETSDAAAKYFAFLGCTDVDCRKDCRCSGCSLGVGECHSCVASECAPQCGQCEASKECMSGVECATLCPEGSSACEDACFARFGAAAILEPYSSCADTFCKIPCQD